jgi:hypothetical protein
MPIRRRGVADFSFSYLAVQWTIHQDWLRHSLEELSRRALGAIGVWNFAERSEVKMKLKDRKGELNPAISDLG